MLSTHYWTGDFGTITVPCLSNHGPNSRLVFSLLKNKSRYQSKSPRWIYFRCKVTRYVTEQSALILPSIWCWLLYKKLTGFLLVEDDPFQSGCASVQDSDLIGEDLWRLQIYEVRRTSPSPSNRNFPKTRNRRNSSRTLPAGLQSGIISGFESHEQRKQRLQPTDWGSRVSGCRANFIFTMSSVNIFSLTLIVWNPLMENQIAKAYIQFQFSLIL